MSNKLSQENKPSQKEKLSQENKPSQKENKLAQENKLSFGKDRPFIIKENNNNLLLIPTGITVRKRALTTLAVIKKNPGWIVSEDNSIQKWYFSGFIEKQGKVFIYGSYVPGKSLDEILNLKPAKGLPYLLKLVDAQLLLKDKHKEIDFFDFQTDSVFFLENRDVLFLPPYIMNNLKDSRTPEYRANAHETINHPYLRGEEKRSFCIASLLFRLLTGKFPYTGNTEEEVRSKLRNLKATPPVFIIPELKKDISDTIIVTLEQPNLMSLYDWEVKLKQWISNGIFHNISIKERELILSRAGTQKKRTAFSFNIKIFFEKNWKRISGISAAAIIFTFIVTLFAINILKPRTTKGFTPLEVVKTFYTSITSMDHTTMSDCVINGAGNAKINEVINVYITSSHVFAYEKRSYLLPSDKWVSKGRPDLLPPYFVYGIVDLEIIQEKKEPDIIYLVSYEKWSRKDMDSEMEMPRIMYEGNKIKERVKLKKDKDDWVIYSIEQIEYFPI